MGWLTAADPRTREMWPGCADLTPAEQDHVLSTAAVQCAAFAPAPAVDGTGLPIIPNHWCLAQAMQARALAKAGFATMTPAENSIGGYGDSVPVPPMDWTVKQILRPRHAVPVIA